MRWKLLLFASLIASVAGAGATLAIVVFLLGSARRLATPDIIAFATLLIPVALIIGASIFVYRHTARRRKLQAMATGLLAAILTLAIMILSLMFMANSERYQPPVPQPGRIA